MRPPNQAGAPDAAFAPCVAAAPQIQGGDHLDCDADQPLVHLLEVVDRRNMPTRPANWSPTADYLAFSVGAGEQDAGLTAARPDHHPPLRPPVVGRRGKILDQVEAQDLTEEVDRGLILVDHQGDELKAGHGLLVSG
jgi:hypothetical protein